ncbi:hypothetical protein ARMSODRAFT_968669 [Armillaria solidipes]|uniref:Uncharacterized protein n=1 Tax=Armillaria solidipes TaxID=1076256 RepID=A0A2H3CR10_9AGAR|nr:hypothetical protein ARMSODRAFT_968669 [Armillaria solidipes]
MYFLAKYTFGCKSETNEGVSLVKHIIFQCCEQKSNSLGDHLNGGYHAKDKGTSQRSPSHYINGTCQREHRQDNRILTQLRPKGGSPPSIPGDGMSDGMGEVIALDFVAMALHFFLATRKKEYTGIPVVSVVPPHYANMPENAASK